MPNSPRPSIVAEPHQDSTEVLVLRATMPRHLLDALQAMPHGSVKLRHLRHTDGRNWRVSADRRAVTEALRAQGLVVVWGYVRRLPGWLQAIASGGSSAHQSKSSATG